MNSPLNCPWTQHELPEMLIDEVMQRWNLNVLQDIGKNDDKSREILSVICDTIREIRGLNLFSHLSNFVLDRDTKRPGIRHDSDYPTNRDTKKSPISVQFLSFSCSFRQIFSQIIEWCIPILGLITLPTHLSGKSWIHGNMNTRRYSTAVYIRFYNI